MSHCETCCCEHAGKFPRFAFFYSDDSVYRGGGPEDTEQVVYSLPRSFVELPLTGLTIAMSEDSEVGRRNHSGMEQVYALAPQTRGGPDITASGPETRLIPMLAQYGIVKLGEHARTERYHEIMRRAMADDHVPMQSAKSPYELTGEKD